MVKIINSTIIEMPAPLNISSWWNLGSLLGLCLTLQIITGLFIAMHFTSQLDHAFSSVVHLTRDVNYGWLLRLLHANGASFFFVCLYLHIGRGLYYSSFTMTYTWTAGVTLLLISMATAFLGYVLPCGQMSFWGATVITNLVSTIPWLGKDIVLWLWGGFAVDAATLTRFFALHFMLPFIILGLVAVHVLFLHQTGSNNPLGLESATMKITFHPYFTMKDTVGFVVLSALLLFVNMCLPYTFGDPENFTPANPLSTPPHIQPECYYLFAYAILRAIPNKLGGVVALVMSIFMLYLLPMLHFKKKRSLQFYPLNQLMFYNFLATVGLLTWVGACPVETPFILTSQLLSVAYFSWFFLDPLTSVYWDQNKN